MKKWRRSVCCLCLLLLIFLGGCQEKESLKNQKNVTITFYNQKPEIKEVMGQIIKDFEKENPGIRIKQISPKTGEGNLQQRMEAGERFDVMTVYPNEKRFVVNVGKEVFMDLSGEDFLNNLDSNILSSIKFHGKDYSVPLTVNTYGLFYNADEFQKRGFSVPNNWEELKELTNQVNQEGSIPFALSLKEPWSVGHLSEAILGNVALRSDWMGFVNSPKDAEKEKCLWTTLEGVHLFLDNCQPGAEKATYEDAIESFVKGEALMLPQGTWATPLLKQKNIPFSYKMMAIPAKGNKETLVPYGVDLALAVGNQTQHPREAKKFLAYCTAKKVAQRLHNKEESSSVVVGVTPTNVNTYGVTKYLYTGQVFPWPHFDWPVTWDEKWQDIFAKYGQHLDVAKFFDQMNHLFHTKENDSR